MFNKLFNAENPKVDPIIKSNTNDVADELRKTELALISSILSAIPRTSYKDWKDNEAIRLCGVHEEVYSHGITGISIGSSGKVISVSVDSFKLLVPEDMEPRASAMFNTIKIAVRERKKQEKLEKLNQIIAQVETVGRE